MPYIAKSVEIEERMVDIGLIDTVDGLTSYLQAQKRVIHLSTQRQ